MHFRATKLAALASTLVMALAVAPPAAADPTVSSIRVRLHPYAAAAGELPSAALAKLEALVGTGLSLTSTTRTGALDLKLAEPQDSARIAATLRALRNDRSVLWAETPRVASAIVTKSAAATPPALNQPGQRLLVRLKDGVTADWATLLPQLGSRVGTTLSVERRIGNVWVLSVPVPQLPAQLAQMAAQLQQDGAVQYADPVRRAMALAAPNDPYYAQQWSLNDPLSGINAETAWTLQPDSSSVVVAVVDTGILPHPDLEGRLLAGYDFISDPLRARDGDARDPDPRDEGDWTTDDECGAPQPSFFHGLFVAGIIAANANNGIGIAGLTTGSRILPVRVLGKCGGTFDDVLAGMLWASGVQIDGVPPNPNPAKVINLSLGGVGACDQSIQEAVDDALAQGAVVVAAAGNESGNVQDFTPASCSGVITVAASTVDATLTSYSNFGQRVDVSAPGGDFTPNGLIVSTANDGTTVPQNPDYEFGAGTSFAAPMVSGTAALMLARNPMLTGGRVLDIVTGTARDFPTSSICAQTNLCGSGTLNTGAAISSTLPGGSTPPLGAFQVVEYYNADLDHYFITAQPAEIAYIDAVLYGSFQRTGLYFYAYLSPFTAPPGSRPVCRFFAAGLINSHFFTADGYECQFVLTHWPGIWYLETPASFYIQVPDYQGACPAGTLPVYRFFNNRNDANHRYTVDLSVRRAMLNRAWVPEGNGPNSVAFCSVF